MKKSLLLVLLLFVFYKMLAQDKYDDIIIYADSSNSHKFYEGQAISFMYHVDNTSNEKKNYHRSLTPVKTKFYDVTNNTEIKKAYTFSQQIPHVGEINFEKRAVENPIAPLAKYCEVVGFGFDVYGNIDMGYFIPLSDDIKKKFMHRPLFLKAGKYRIDITCVLFPSDKSISEQSFFEVIPAKGKVKAQLINYLGGLNYALQNSFVSDVNILASETENTLWKVLKEDLTSPYSSDLVRLLSDDVAFKISSVIYYRHDLNQIFKLFEIIPKLTSFTSIETGVGFMDRYTGYTKKFQEAGIIPDANLYINNYLKSIEHLHPMVSEKLILEAKNYKIGTDYINYAQLRVDKKNK